MPSWNAPPGKGYSNFSGAPLTTNPSSASGNIFKALDGGLAGRDGIWNEFSATSFAHAGTEQFASRVGEFLGSSAEISAARLTSKIAPASQNINDSLRAHVYLPAEPPAPAGGSERRAAGSLSAGYADLCGVRTDALLTRPKLETFTPQAVCRASSTTTRAPPSRRLLRVRPVHSDAATAARADHR